jgi:hypothetical protein
VAGPTFWHLATSAWRPSISKNTRALGRSRERFGHHCHVTPGFHVFHVVDVFEIRDDLRPDLVRARRHDPRFEVRSGDTADCSVVIDADQDTPATKVAFSPFGMLLCPLVGHERFDGFLEKRLVSSCTGSTRSRRRSARAITHSLPESRRVFERDGVMPRHTRSHPSCSAVASSCKQLVAVAALLVDGLVVVLQAADSGVVVRR